MFSACFSLFYVGNRELPTRRLVIIEHSRIAPVYLSSLLLLLHFFNIQIIQKREIVTGFFFSLLFLSFPFLVSFSQVSTFTTTPVNTIWAWLSDLAFLRIFEYLWLPSRFDLYVFACSIIIILFVMFLEAFTLSLSLFFFFSLAPTVSFCPFDRPYIHFFLRAKDIYL
jgi:hypothetical protein